MSCDPLILFSKLVVTPSLSDLKISHGPVALLFMKPEAAKYFPDKLLPAKVVHTRDNYNGRSTVNDREKMVFDREETISPGQNAREIFLKLTIDRMD